jgi:16S rRNA (adenine1518-N6/adenine1519-N6)-dimethyltransferase
MPRKELGQHFLYQSSIAGRIADQLHPAAGETIIEIGAGPGILSEQLLNKFAPPFPLLLIEYDCKLAEALTEKFSSRQLRIIQADVLQVELDCIDLPNPSVCLIGNIPYYISKPIVDWIICNSNQITHGVLMTQKEFYQKLQITNKGCQSSQNAIFNYLYQSKKCFDVLPGSFFPPPKVMSTVFSFFRNQATLPGIDAKQFYVFLKQLFALRRKTIANNLKASATFSLPDNQPASFHSLISKRPDQLSVPQLLELFQAAGKINLPARSE